MAQPVQQPSHGDRVRVTLADERAFEGILMPKHAFTGGDTIVLKLDNGYNFGLDATGAKVAVVKPKAEVAVEWSLPPEDPDKPTIAVLGTGGTIASFVDYRTGGVYPATKPEELVAAAPDLADVCNVRAEVVFQMFSEDMQPEHWTQIAARAAWHLNNGARGVVIPHGTDTMGHTAAALAFCLRDLPGPVVLVGSQRSSDRPSSDASLNLLAAAQVAATADLGEVVVCMHASSSDDAIAIHRATRVRKMHTSRRDAFQSINERPLGHVVHGKVHFDRRIAPPRAGPATVDAAWDEDVSMIYCYPGLWPDHIEDVVRKATILVGTGLGHVARRCLPGIEKVIQRGAHVAMTSQCINGRVNMNVYSTGRDLLQMGVLSGEGMLPEVAYIKMMWILGHTEDADEVRRLFMEDLAGEMGDATDHRSFGHEVAP